MSRVIQSNSLPSAIEAKLRSVRIRQATLVVLQAIAVAASVLIAVMVVSMFIDWVFTLTSTTMRVALTAITMVATIATLLAFSKPVRRALGWTEAAENVDEIVPQLQERWTTIANVAASDHSPKSPTARAMLDQVTSEAVAIGAMVQPKRVAPPEKLKPSFLFLGACLLLLFLFLATNWAQTSVLLRRFWSPTADITATQLASLSGDIQVPRGEPVELVSNQSGLARSFATLTMETDTGIVDVVELEPEDERPESFVHTVRADQPFRYRMAAGDAQGQWHSVRVIDYPALEEVKFSVTAPAYVNRPKYEKPLLPSRVRVVQGSEFVLELKPVDELDSLTLALTVSDPTSKDQKPSAQSATENIAQNIQLKPDADGWYRFDTQLMGDLSLKPLLVNRHGLTNEDQHTCHIQVIPDKAPVARVINRDDNMAVGLDEVIDVKMEAHDDHGIASAELVVYDESDAADGNEPKILKTIPIPLGDQQYKKHVLANIKLDLSKLGVKEGASISYSVRVTDTRDLNFDPTRLAKLTDTDGKQGKPSDGKLARSSDTNKPGAQNDRKDELVPAMPIEKADGNQKSKEKGGSSSQNQLADQNDSKKKDPGEKIAANGAKPDAKRAQQKQDSSKQNAASAKPDPKDAKSDDMARALLASNQDRRQDRKQNRDKREPNNRAKNGEPKSSDVANRQSPQPNASNRSNSRPTDTNQSPSNRPGRNNVVRIINESDDNKPDNNRKNASSRNRSETKKPGKPNARKVASGSKRPREFRMSGQQSAQPQNTMTTRRRLKIATTLTSVAKAEFAEKLKGQIRDRVVEIDKMLAESESGLRSIVKREIRDADRAEQFRRLDKQLEAVEKYVSDLRNETKEKQFAFVGLQMVDITRTNVTPARDRVFDAIRDPSVADKNARRGLQHIVRARESLAGLLKRYDRVQGERKLKKNLDEWIQWYEVYVERQQSLMRERQQNRNPLDRKIAIVQVDQEYLDRYAEVQEMRREMLRELGRLLGDDPRLLARYLDLIRRRRQSLRDQLSDLVEQQDEIAMELSNWIAVGDEQREDFWNIIAELRMQATSTLAKDAAEMSERLTKNLPLTLDPKVGTARTLLQHASEVARLARKISFDVEDFLDSGDSTAKLPVRADSETLVAEFSELLATLDQLRFENESDEEATAFVDGRFLEARTVADQADAWLANGRYLVDKQYHQLALIEQQRVSIETELLRGSMLDMESQVRNEFLRAQADTVPGHVTDLIRELQSVMHGVTLHQAAVGFALSQNKLKSAEKRQTQVLDGFDEAERVFDKLRRAVIAALDEMEVQDPDIAQLRDPTLDEFLARLEREPNLQAQLGIPNRRRNFRIIASSMTWQRNGSGLLGQSGQAASARARQAMQMKRNSGGKKKQQKELTDEERKRQKEAQQMQKDLEESLVKLREKSQDPKLSEQQRKQMQRAADKLKKTMDALNQGDEAGGRWQLLVAQEEAASVMRAMAAGEKVPEEQWNRLISKLGDGLWQVRGTNPPEEYQKSIDQYQRQLRELLNTISEGV